MDRIWEEHVMNSQAIKDYAKNRGAFFAPSYGYKAKANAMPVVITEACARKAAGEAAIDPATIGIDCL